MEDDELLQFAAWLLDRFIGAAPDEKVLNHAIFDFKVILARNRVASAHTADSVVHS